MISFFLYVVYHCTLLPLVLHLSNRFRDQSLAKRSHLEGNERALMERPFLFRTLLEAVGREGIALSSSFPSSLPTRLRGSTYPLSQLPVLHNTLLHVNATSPPAHSDQAHRAPRPRRAQSLLRQRANLPLMAPLHRRPWWPRRRTPQFWR